MAKLNARNVRRSADSADRKVEKVTHSKHYQHIVGALAVIIGIFYVLTNLPGILWSVVGLVLIYLGMKLLGFSIPIPEM
ncbi:MAG: hypothetical protein KGH71_03645 [Candidatus Micrarchaeota archaeon]|nr:hypothetical protein [Candidatus Micrarchaeota archaeon]